MDILDPQKKVQLVLEQIKPETILEATVTKLNLSVDISGEGRIFWERHWWWEKQREVAKKEGQI